MLNLEDELREYIDEGSINWSRLNEKVRAMIAVKEKRTTDTRDGKDFISKIKNFGTISFRFADKRKQCVNVLTIEHPVISTLGMNIMVKSMNIAPVVPAVAEATSLEEIPMFIDNEWWKSTTGQIFRWLGKKNYIIGTETKDPIHLLKNIDTGEISEVSDTFREMMIRVEPINKNGKIVYENKETDV